MMQVKIIQTMIFLKIGQNTQIILNLSNGIDKKLKWYLQKVAMIF